MSDQPADRPRLHSAERTVFFTDAVVAIAMTLLILPLMESVGEFAAEHGDAAEWLHEHDSQLLSFVLSFVLTGVFWRSHHRLFEYVERVTQAMMALNFAWMFTIVWLPVATALVGAIELTSPATGAYDRVLIGLYIGTMCANALLMYLLEVAVRRRPECWTPENPPARVGESVALATLILFLAAALLALALPPVNLFALLLLLLTGPLQGILHRRMRPLRVPDPAEAPDPGTAADGEGEH